MFRHHRRVNLTVAVVLVASGLASAEPKELFVNVFDFAPPEAKADGKFDWNSDEGPYLQNALDAAYKTRHVVKLPPGRYRTTRMLQYPHILRMVGAGIRTSVIIGDHDGPAVLSMKGSAYSVLEHLGIEPRGTETGLLLGRRPGPPSNAGCNNFRHIEVRGRATKATVYSIASEVNVWDHCFFQQDPGGAGKHVFYLSRRNDLDVVPLLDQVNTVHTFISCSFINNTLRTGTEQDEGHDCVFINTTGCQHALFLNCYFVAANGCYVRISVPDSYFGPIHFIGCGNERAGAAYTVEPRPPIAGIIIESPKHDAQTFEGLWFDNSSFSFAGQPSVWVKDPITLVNFRYNFMSSNGYGGALRLYSVRNSRIKVRDNEYYNGAAGRGRIVEIAGDATGNTFIGPIHQFQIAGKDVGNTYRDTTGAGLTGQRQSVMAQTENFAIPRNLSGLVLTNTGATEPVRVTLPKAERGLHFTIIKEAPAGITIAAAQGDVVEDVPRLTNDTQNETTAMISLLCASDGRWIITYQRGTWQHAP